MFYSQISLQSDLSRMHEIDSLLDVVMQQCGIKEDFLGVMNVPLHKCVENAIIHGNKCDKNKKVLIEVQLKQSELLFSITDEGAGFDYDSVLKQNIEHSPKSGLLIVKMLTKNLSFAKNGSQVFYTVDVPFSFSAGDKRMDVLQQSQQSVVKNSQMRI